MGPNIHAAIQRFLDETATQSADVHEEGKAIAEQMNLLNEILKRKGAEAQADIDALIIARRRDNAAKAAAKRLSDAEDIPF